MKRVAVIMLLGLLLAGCASQDNILFRPSVSAADEMDRPFDASGRLSVEAHGRSQMGNFEWQHALDQDALSINSPLGNTVARLTRDPHGVVLEADGKRWLAPDVEILMQQRLGWSLPLDNLVWWIRGWPAPDLPVSHDADGNLLQQGWRIRFLTDAQQSGPYPRRVDLSRDGVNIRLITSNWQ